MTNDTTINNTGPATPLVFGAAQGSCFGWFHAAQQPLRRVGVLLCRPIGYESICTYGAYTQLAETLACMGFDVIRFDYQGTGDSSGNDAEPDRVKAWTDSVVAGINELRRLSGTGQVVLFAVRMGATLAVRAALQTGGVDSIVMWAPCVTGRSFVRELRAACANAATDRSTAGDIEALGYLYTAQTLDALQKLDCIGDSTPPCRNVLIMGRDDMPGEGPLPASYRQMGMSVSHQMVPGYCEMMSNPTESLMPPETLNLITGWLCSMHPLASADNASRCATTVATIESAASPVEHVHEGIRELAVRFGPDQLFGILSEPAEPQPQDKRGNTVILMLNVGGNYRIGPNRIYVKMGRSLAAAGYRALRFDMTGIGDSRSASRSSMTSMVSPKSVIEVRSVIDGLADRGFNRFYLLGICSGALVAFQTALADARVSGQILLNARLLEWPDEVAAGAWQDSVRRPYKSIDFYRRALLRPGVYSRLLLGKVNVWGIAGRFSGVVQARIKRLMMELLRPGSFDDGVLAQVKRLGARGTDTLVIVAAQEDGRDYLEFHFGSHGSRMKGDPYFRMVVIENSDHTFSTLDSQRQLITTIQAQLEKRLLFNGPAQGPVLAEINRVRNMASSA